MPDLTLTQLAQFALSTRPDTELIRRHQRQIYENTLRLSRAMDQPNFKRIVTDDLQRMVLMYDQAFFQGQLVRLARREGLTFALSSRMTRNAGKTITRYPVGYQKGSRTARKFEIVLSSSLLFQTFHDVHRPVEVTGIVCHNRLEAMQRITEHEIVHLLEMLVWDDSSCSQGRFQSIANRFFAHTQHQHDLITQKERAVRKFRVRVGSRVSFRFEGKRLQGIVNRITRRATVLVPDAKGEPFNDGQRYRRYYVPLEMLTLLR